MPEAAFDLVLGAALLAVAWQALGAAELFRGVVLYIVFGLLVSLAWVRLHAPDIALAEAAIGAGVTGALLLDALSLMERPATAPPPRPLRWAALATTLGFAGLAAAAVLALPDAPGGLTRAAGERLADSGVENPVTAVLLAFRGYDTWLELVVLFTAAVGMLALHGARGLDEPASAADREDLLAWALPRLLPVALLVAVYLLARGAYAPGGAFQAGAVGAALGVLLFLAGGRSVGQLGGTALRVVLLLGAAAFWVAGAGAVLAGRRLLELPPAGAYAALLGIELAAALAIGFSLAALFVGARPPRDTG